MAQKLSYSTVVVIKKIRNSTLTKRKKAKQQIFKLANN